MMSLIKFVRRLSKPAENKFKFFMDDEDQIWYLVGYPTAGVAKQDIIVFVTAENQVVILSTGKEAVEIVAMPADHNYDPEAVTGIILEGGGLLVSFPLSKGANVKIKRGFQVKIV